MVHQISAKIEPLSMAWKKKVKYSATVLKYYQGVTKI
jgi:hypothetical protein